MADLLKQSEQTNILQTCLFGATDPILFGATDTTPKTTKDMAALSPKSKETVMLQAGVKGRDRHSKHLCVWSNRPDFRDNQG